ncbi:MAG: lysylphosphatidylglycerol synthase transmembrane domain-containing protein [Candidatus Aminicenantia bacterium]
MKKFLSLIFRFIVSISLIIYVFTKIDLKNVTNCVKEANFLLLIFSLSLHFVGAFLGSSRWKVLLDSYGINLKQSSLYKLYMIGSFFNAFLPTSVGGDAVRMLKISSLTEKRAQAVTSVIVERFIGMLVLYIISFFSFLIYFKINEQREIFFTILILVFLSLLFIAFIYSPLAEEILRRIPSYFLKEKFEKMRYSLISLGRDRKGVVKVFILTTILQVNVVIYYFLISISIGINLSILHFFILIPLILTITMLPITIGGIGLRESGFVLLFSKFGVLPEKALVLSILGYFISLVFAGIGGIVFVFERGNEKN